MNILLMNNWQCLDHQRLYRRPDAFYDLYDRGVEGKYARGMAIGSRCAVLSKDSHGRIVIHRHTLEMVRNIEGVHVMCGPFERGLVLSRANAILHPVYGKFFDKRGHVVQWSVLLHKDL